MSQSIIILLDESGSMIVMDKELVDAINDFIKDQQTALSDDSTLTIWKFNTNCNKLYDNINLSEMKGLKYSDFHPSGMTSLYDAIGKSITDKKDDKDVICLIITDGVENSSQEFSGKQAKYLINKMETENNWKFMYLGANQDSFKEGENIGINTARCANFTTDASPNDLRSMARTASNSIKRFKTTGQEMSLH